MRRRDFLASLPATGLMAACGEPRRPALPPVVATGADVVLGHQLRRGTSADFSFPPPDQTRRVDVLIVGGGIGGLAAAWRLQRSGFGDFLLAELEGELGGNSRAASDSASAYPLGAHYLPLPPPQARAVRALLRELGAMHGDGNRLADYDENLLAAAPQERLYINGWWQEGLWPSHRVPAAELAQQQRFREHMAKLRRTHDEHGRRAFALPLDESSNHPPWRELDHLSLRDWLLQEGYTAPGIHWMANYATRDDFGTDYAETSAWAGLHYFACRANDELEGHVLTTPGGNGWLAQGLARGLQGGDNGQVLSKALAYKVEETRNGVVCDLFLPATGRSLRVTARQLVWAAPLLTVPHVFANPQPEWLALARRTEYAPWVVANLSLSAPPVTRAGAPLAWDNVFYDSASLGYVLASHQAPRYAPAPTVITWYRALYEPAVPPRQRRLLQEPPESWAAAALADIARPHPEIRDLVTRIHVHSHAHAMIRPRPGTIWDPARAALKRGSTHVAFAHADVSGMSLFEEALQRGVVAAEAVLRRLGKPVPDSLA
jgi:monoamine oxidase